MPRWHPDQDGAERRQVGAGIDVDRLQLTDLVTVGVDNVVPAPFPDVIRLEHASLLSRAVALLFYWG
jgi:hypothetical protein